MSARSLIQTWSPRLRPHRPEWPQILPEDSLLLRILAQLLVIIGIIATDTSADTTVSLWAVPASIIGATWSWHHRRSRNITVKFLLAIGMIAALIFFFRDLLFGGQLNDTRVALAQLLVQIQVLHSFDLPRRKDLGYSMVIGLILVSVASTLSQTMLFGVWLLLFLAIALPVLVMDYRARLGLQHWQWSAVLGTRRRRWTGLPLIFGVVVGLGLLIFAVMPRLPGYQIQTFPVSAPIETQGEFDQSNVINPAYVGEGTGSGNGVRAGRGQAPVTGSGEVDDTFYSGFGTKINQNLRGQLTEKVVMRVRSQAAGFWRVMAFDRYTGQGWEMSRNAQTETIQRAPWSYQFLLKLPMRLNRVQRVVQTYSMVSDLPNVIPALDQPRQVFFPTQAIAVDQQDGLRSPVSLTEGLTYTVISAVPYRDRQLLQQAKSQFFDTSQKSAQNDRYREISPALQSKLKILAEELLSQSNTPITADYEKALFLAQALKQRYSLQQDLPFLDAQEDLVDAFFFKHQGGYRDHFSTALTMLLRSIGMSTRLVTGFAPGQFNPFTGYYIVKNTDAYAMTEVYFHKYGWFTFDPIPGHPLIPPSIEENQTFSALQSFWKWVAGWLPSPVTGWLSWAFGGLFAQLGRLIGQFMALFRQGWWGWLVGILGLISVVFAGWLTWLGYQRWCYWRKLQQLPPIARLYQQLIDWLGLRGLSKHPAQTPREYAQMVRESASPAGDRTTEVITNAYLDWRYGGSTTDLADLQQQFRQLQRQYRRSRLQQLSQTLRTQFAHFSRWGRS